MLGPVNTPEEYRAAVLRDDVALLREGGMIADKARRWVVGLEAEVGSLGYQARDQLGLFVEAEAAEGDNAGRASKKAKMVEKRKAVAAELKTAPEDQRRRLAAELRVLDDQVRRLAPDAVAPAAFWSEKARRVAEARRSSDRSPNSAAPPTPPPPRGNGSKPTPRCSTRSKSLREVDPPAGEPGASHRRGRRVPARPGRVEGA